MSKKNKQARNQAIKAELDKRTNQQVGNQNTDSTKAETKAIEPSAKTENTANDVKAESPKAEVKAIPRPNASTPPKLGSSLKPPTKANEPSAKLESTATEVKAESVETKTPPTDNVANDDSKRDDRIAVVEAMKAKESANDETAKAESDVSAKQESIAESVAVETPKDTNPTESTADKPSAKVETIAETVAESTPNAESTENQNTDSNKTPKAESTEPTESETPKAETESPVIEPIAESKETENPPTVEPTKESVVETPPVETPKADPIVETPSAKQESASNDVKAESTLDPKQYRETIAKMFNEAYRLSGKFNVGGKVMNSVLQSGFNYLLPEFDGIAINLDVANERTTLANIAMVDVSHDIDRHAVMAYLTLKMLLCQLGQADAWLWIRFMRLLDNQSLEFKLEFADRLSEFKLGLRGVDEVDKLDGFSQVDSDRLIAMANAIYNCTDWSLVITIEASDSPRQSDKVYKTQAERLAEAKKAKAGNKPSNAATPPKILNPSDLPSSKVLDAERQKGGSKFDEKLKL